MEVDPFVYINRTRVTKQRETYYELDKQSVDRCFFIARPLAVAYSACIPIAVLISGDPTASGR